MTEHGFTKHGFSQRNTIECANKFVIDPCLHAVGQAVSVKIAISCHHVWHNPGARLTLAGAARTGLDDLFKSRIDSNFTAWHFAKFLQCFSQRWL